MGAFLTEGERKMPDRFVTNAARRPLFSLLLLLLQRLASVSGITALQA